MMLERLLHRRRRRLDATSTVPSSSTSILTAGLLDDAADGLAAGADQVADAVRLDLDRDDARRVRRELARAACRCASAILPRMWSRPCAGLLERLRHDRRALTPPILMSICTAVTPSRGAGDLEVHVAEVVLVAEDVGEDADLVAFLDEAHRDAGDRRLDRARPRPSATASRRRRVAIDDEPFDSRISETMRIVYGKSSSSGRTGSERALGERAVADLAPAGAAQELRLAGAEAAGSCSGA